MSAKRRIGFWGWLLRVTAVGYPAALLLITLGLRFIGERWWVTTIALYLPRYWFGLPLPVLTFMLLFGAGRRWLITQMIAAWLLLFPLMGFQLPPWRTQTAGGDRLRVFSMNVEQSFAGTKPILARLRAARADIVLMQELGVDKAKKYERGLPHYGFHVTDDEFLLASRYPIEDVFVPPRIPQDPVPSSYVRYRIALPSGPIVVYNIHPLSPRDAFEELRGTGSQAEALLSGKFLRLSAPPPVTINTRLRLRQLRAIMQDVKRQSYPVIIAGDTNLPGGGWAVEHWFGELQDGFAEAGSGFGYTYPRGKRRRPWIRLDRVLAGAQFRFVDFSVIESKASDHLAVLAELERREGD